MTLLPASLILRKEPFISFRLWSYVVTSVVAVCRPRRVPDADVVITVSDYFCDILPALILKKRNPKVRWVAWIHHRETPPRERPGNPLVNRLVWQMQAWSFRKVAQVADEAWTYETDAGDLVRAELLRLGMRDAQVCRMKCGMELGDVPAEDVPKRVDAVMVGVRPNKGMYDIVPVWKEVARRRPGTTLRLMGGMVDTVPLVEDFKRHGLDGLVSIFKSGGWVDTPTHYRTLKEARVMFAPSREEGWGIAVCEAMACGLPVIGYDLPTYRRIYGDSFVKIPIGDTATFAAEICKMLDSAAEFEAFQKKGLQCAQQYGWDAIAEEDWAYLWHFRK
jgi:glycosyltransferase involved in cell wall biosynthesis